MAAFITRGVALVTGAASGIGQGAANALVRAGASVIIFADINEEGAKKAAEYSIEFAVKPGGELKSEAEYNAIGKGLDVTDPTAVTKLVQWVVQNFKRIDYLVHAAGVDQAYYAPTPEDSLEDYDRVMDVNAKGTLIVSRAVIKQMLTQTVREWKSGGQNRELQKGAIVLVTSAMSYGAVPGKPAYAASKHAALGIMRSLCTDHAANGIRVNLVAPTWVRTAMFAEECRRVPQTLELIKQAVPLKRPADPDEVGNCIVFLLSPAASYVHGQGLIIDGGTMKGMLFI